MSTVTFCPLPQRTILSITGADRIAFLQGLISNDVRKVNDNTPIWAALLTPQGRFLFDMFIISDGETLRLDVETERAEALLKKLNIYRLRSKVSLNLEPDWQVIAILPPHLPSFEDGRGFIDPRDQSMGQRYLVPPAVKLPSLWQEIAFSIWDTARIQLGLPDGSRDLIPEKSLLLNNRFEALNGVDFEKGCYIGQEVTARTKYRGMVRKTLLPIRSMDGTTPLPNSRTAILAGDQEVGVLHSHCGSVGLASLKIDFLSHTALTCGSVSVKLWAEAVAQP